jgi:predicted short-subunit dehydrogenase-like oxidoreductase (DUF2520 family)
MNVAIMGMGRLGRSLNALLSTKPGVRVETWRRGMAVPLESDVYWICVPDGAISEVAQIIPVGAVVLHASGACDLGVLAPHKNVGSIHPLQSFPGPDLGIPAPETTPAAIAGTPAAKEQAWRLAETIGFRPFTVEGDRRAYHAAAVIAGNFATLLLDQACLLLSSTGVDPSNAPAILSPLMRSSIDQANGPNPLEALTGPIARGDTLTVESHLEFLASHSPEILEMYKKLSERAVERLHGLGQIKSEDLENWQRLLR